MQLFKIFGFLRKRVVSREQLPLKLPAVLGESYHLLSNIWKLERTFKARVVPSAQTLSTQSAQTNEPWVFACWNSVHAK